MFERLVPARALAIILLLGLSACRDAAFKTASKRDTTRPCGTGTPTAASMIFAMSFFMASEEACTPECE